MGLSGGGWKLDLTWRSDADKSRTKLCYGSGRKSQRNRSIYTFNTPCNNTTLTALLGIDKASSFTLKAKQTSEL